MVQGTASTRKACQHLVSYHKLEFHHQWVVFYRQMSSYLRRVEVMRECGGNEEELEFLVLGHITNIQ